MSYWVGFFAGICWGAGVWAALSGWLSRRRFRRSAAEDGLMLPAGMFAVWGGDPETAPHCPRCERPAAGVFAFSSDPTATVYTIPCNHELQPDQAMALRMAAGALHDN